MMKGQKVIKTEWNCKSKQTKGNVIEYIIKVDTSIKKNKLPRHRMGLGETYVYNSECEKSAEHLRRLYCEDRCDRT